jgi:hypothetical protein
MPDSPALLFPAASKFSSTITRSYPTKGPATE